MTKIIELADKDIKIAFINVFHMFKKIKKSMSMIRRKNFEDPN